jgi:hypothetical protein
MGLIVDYTSLQAVIIDYLARDQDSYLIARIPTLIQLFEAKMNRSLFVRQMEQRSMAVTTFAQTDCEFIALPSDFQSMRRIRLTSAGGSVVTGKRPLEFKSTVQMDEFRTENADVPGKPKYFSIFGSEIELAPTPNAAYTVEMIYRQNIPPLATNTTNWLLTLSPDLYLYGALMEAAPSIKEDQRIETWGALFASALGDLNQLGTTSTFNAGPLSVRPSGLNVW